MTPDVDNRADGKPFAVILGATSFIGRHLVGRLSDLGFEGLCVSRHPEPTPYKTPPGFSWSTFSNEERSRVPASAVVFSLIPIPALPGLVSRMVGGDRLIALSSSSALFKAESSDPAERSLAQGLRRAEQETQSLSQDRGIAWTIFRPTLVYDPGRDRNVSVIASFVRRFGAFPIISPGTGRRQPIHAEDVAEAMVAAWGTPGARNVLFGLPGGETLTYREMVRRIFRSLGQRPVLLHLPLGLARAAFRVWRTLTTGARYSAASLERINMDLTLDPAPVREALGITGRPFHPEFPEPLDPPRPFQGA